MCLLSSALCTTAGVRVMGLMITAYGLPDATYTPLSEMQSREARMEAIVAVGQSMYMKYMLSSSVLHDLLKSVDSVCGLT